MSHKNVAQKQLNYLFALSTNEPIGPNIDNGIEHSKKVRRSMLGVAHCAKG